jgi:3-hydroxyisobutyrate dehydrogenase-like beta-hydroxyacid dehydrogenase
MTSIAILHPGEMGAALGHALVDIGHQVYWIPDGRSQATRTRADSAGLRPLTSPRELSGCDLVVSVCPPGSAVDVSRSISGYRGIFLDANAIAPATAERIADEVARNGMRYLDGGIIGPPPERDGTTRLYLSGPDASGVAELFRGARIDARIIDTANDTAASGLKRIYAAWTKISAALVVAIDATADRLELREALHGEWELSQPDLVTRLGRARDSATGKGWRWESEMREIAATFASAGEPDGFGLAAAEVFHRFRRP